ncbi:hypothetical protein OC846_006744 [Tilletia horrida]|uniref:Uncharacterized protein n=1 Tax=Tilletia horrida TaxID=155126 RepID=A0AAN6GIZ2_9BASI|nr:hypothetical protein OC846_006744 [Tilletia horrida]
MLTAYPEVRERALETAMLFNPQYDLPEPKGLLQMGIQWREVQWRFGSPTYKAFPAVAAVLFMWDDRI